MYSSSFPSLPSPLLPIANLNLSSTNLLPKTLSSSRSGCLPLAFLLFKLSSYLSNSSSSYLAISLIIFIGCFCKNLRSVGSKPNYMWDREGERVCTKDTFCFITPWKVGIINLKQSSGVVELRGIGYREVRGYGGLIRRGDKMHECKGL